MVTNRRGREYQQRKLLFIESDLAREPGKVSTSPPSISFTCSRQFFGFGNICHQNILVRTNFPNVNATFFNTGAELVPNSSTRRLTIAGSFTNWLSSNSVKDTFANSRWWNVAFASLG